MSGAARPPGATSSAGEPSPHGLFYTQLSEPESGSVMWGEAVGAPHLERSPCVNDCTSSPPSPPKPPGTLPAWFTSPRPGPRLPYSGTSEAQDLQLK